MLALVDAWHYPMSSVASRGRTAGMTDVSCSGVIGFCWLGELLIRVELFL